jgi:hypothetical protein
MNKVSMVSRVSRVSRLSRVSRVSASVFSAVHLRGRRSRPCILCLPSQKGCLALTPVATAHERVIRDIRVIRFNRLIRVIRVEHAITRPSEWKEG